MFIRVFRRLEEKELLVNVDHIWKIEVEYNVQGSEGLFWSTSLKEGAENPGAVRIYRLFVGGEVILLKSDPGDPVMNVIEEIYNASIKR